MIKENTFILILALMIDFAVGDPRWLYHPVRIIGKFIDLEERIIRKHLKGSKQELIGGFALLVDTVLVTAASLWIIIYVADKASPLVGFIVKVIAAYTALSSRSLHLEAIQVKKALAQGLEQGRRRVAYIVGRDTDNLTEEEIVKATIETVAENTNDGVIAPMFFIWLLGPVGAIAFKAVNTLDSMVGYRNDKYEFIGKVSAKTDDALNYIPARISAALLVLASLLMGLDYKNSWRIVKRDHGNHTSPNSAWPESAVAGALNIELGGTHEYFGISVYKPAIGDNLKKAESHHIEKTVKLMYVASILFGLIIVAAYFIASKLQAV
jgi:adenosylcobinamide-phosphate synthase